MNFIREPVLLPFIITVFLPWDYYACEKTCCPAAANSCVTCYRYLCGRPLFMLKGILHWVIRNQTVLQVKCIIIMFILLLIYIYSHGSFVCVTNIKICKIFLEQNIAFAIVTIRHTIFHYGLFM